MEKVKKSFNTRDLINLSIVILGTTFILSFPELRKNLLLYFLIVSISLLLRFLAHRLMGNRLKCMINFKLWPLGILIAIFSLALKRVFGIAFLSLGYVEIIPYRFGRWGIKLIKMTPRDYSNIALAGVGANMFLMLFFGIIYTINPTLELFQTISMINGLLAFFSLLPIPPLEGGHIFTYSIWLWVLFIVLILSSLVVVI
jgi:Zn-dependent protease